MHKTETNPTHPFIQHMALTQELARAEWEAAQRIFDIQSAGLRRLMGLHNGMGKRGGSARASHSHASDPWNSLYQQAMTNAMEISTISMDTLAEIQNEMTKSAHEIFPLFKRELLDGVEQISRTIASIPDATTTQHDKAA